MRGPPVCTTSCGVSRRTNVLLLGRIEVSNCLSLCVPLRETAGLVRPYEAFHRLGDGFLGIYMVAKGSTSIEHFACCALTSH
jgi:hypothetical protein